MPCRARPSVREVGLGVRNRGRILAVATDQHWLAVDDSAQLALLDQLVLQDQESSLVEAYGWHGHEDYFPPDISRDGYRHINWRLLLRTWTAQEYVEVVLIECAYIIGSWLSSPYFRGRVDSLRRVELYGAGDETRVRCARLVYRVHPPGSGVTGGYVASQVATARGQATAD